MQIIEYPEASENNCAVILGYFDGVHKAHREIIETAAASKEKDLICVVFTFSNIPNKQISSLLSTEEEKLADFEKCGVDAVYYADFYLIKDLSAEEFVRDILHKNLRAKEVYCGYNYRFAKGASADTSVLQSLCEKYGIKVHCTPKLTQNQQVISSTRIRKLLSEGKLKEANGLLGKEYAISGEIVHGRQIGRSMGTPTINIKPRKEKLLPRFGVYAAFAKIGDTRFKAVVNIGIKPTVTDEAEPTVEAFLLDCNENLYGEYATVYLVKFLRDEQRFKNTDELKSAIFKDVAEAEKIL